MDTSNSETWDLSVLNPDAEIASIDDAEPQYGQEVSVHLWQRSPAHPTSQLTAYELDQALGQDPLVPLAKADSAQSRVHHRFRQHALNPALRHHRGQTRGQSGEAAKRLLDIVGALLLAAVLSPLLLVVGIALARDRGPIIYSHSRTGRHGRPFGCLKFRTMVPNADQVLRDLLQKYPQLRLEWYRDHKLRNDPRVTAIGRFLRRTSLDELPQLWNVLKGDMSLVGPRPVVREELQRYGRYLDTYLAAKPGVTGLWQVMGRSGSCYKRRVALDTYYVRRRSIMMDCYILFRTIRVVLGGRGAW